MPYARRLLLAALTLAAALAVPVAPAQALGKFVESKEVGYARVDPIAHRNQPTSPHKHLFLGSTALLKLAHPESATYGDLVGKGTAMDNPDDTAAYWIPALVYTKGPNAGKPVPFGKYFAYYRCTDRNTTCAAGRPSEPFAPDTRLVTGYPTGAGQVDISKNNWTCDERSSRTGPYRTITGAHCDLARGTVNLTLHLTFPSCWDGRLNSHKLSGDTSDTNHFRFYAKRGGCPPGFSRRVPELRETVKWDYRGDGSNVALTSDLRQRAMGNPVASGQTLHGDYLNSWRQTGGVHGGLVGMVRSCINAKPASWCNS